MRASRSSIVNVRQPTRVIAAIDGGHDRRCASLSIAVAGRNRLGRARSVTDVGETAGQLWARKKAAVTAL
jgi:hypothetical protein